MPRLCFVIMPFSATDSCSAAQWTAIFEELIKPAVEHDAGLGYECRRSVPTRGSLIRGIVEDLQAAHVVIADVTDQNPNVFYELGVRHSLTDRTIIISQNRSHVPFDLMPYANHVYDWESETGRNEFKERINELLREVDERPDRPDNPVSDFLRDARDAVRGEVVANPEVAALTRRVDALEDESSRDRAGRQPGILQDASLMDRPPDENTWADIARRLSRE